MSPKARSGVNPSLPGIDEMLRPTKRPAKVGSPHRGEDDPLLRKSNKHKMHVNAGEIRWMRWALLCVTGLALVSAVTHFVGQGDARYPEPEPVIDPLMDHFVKVVDGRFVVGPSCDPFYASGWNQWESVEAAANVLRLYGASLPKDMTGQELIKSQMSKARQHGFNVVRTWANPVVLEHALMEGPGEYNEAMFRGLVRGHFPRLLAEGTITR